MSPFLMRIARYPYLSEKHRPGQGGAKNDADMRMSKPRTADCY